MEQLCIDATHIEESTQTAPPADAAPGSEIFRLHPA